MPRRLAELQITSKSLCTWGKQLRWIQKARRHWQTASSTVQQHLTLPPNVGQHPPAPLFLILLIKFHNHRSVARGATATVSTPCRSDCNVSHLCQGNETNSFVTRSQQPEDFTRQCNLWPSFRHSYEKRRKPCWWLQGRLKQMCSNPVAGGLAINCPSDISNVATLLWIRALFQSTAVSGSSLGVDGTLVFNLASNCFAACLGCFLGWSQIHQIHSEVRTRMKYIFKNEMWVKGGV